MCNDAFPLAALDGSDAVKLRCCVYGCNCCFCKLEFAATGGKCVTTLANQKSTRHTMLPACAAAMEV